MIIPKQPHGTSFNDPSHGGVNSNRSVFQTVRLSAKKAHRGWGITIVMRDFKLQEV